MTSWWSGGFQERKCKQLFIDFEKGKFLCTSTSKISIIIIVRSREGHPSRRCEYQWGECALLHFCDVRVVFSLLFIFKNPVDLLGAEISIRVRIGMTYPYIEKCSPLSPLETPTVDVMHQGLD